MSFGATADDDDVDNDDEVNVRCILKCATRIAHFADGQGSELRAPASVRIIGAMGSALGYIVGG